jgi:carboxypeptidase C (cathepsin A)
MEEEAPTCIAATAWCNQGVDPKDFTKSPNKTYCSRADSFCENIFLNPYENTGRNLFDMRLPCQHGLPICYETDAITKYFNTPAVQAALGVKAKWQNCDPNINNKFASSGDKLINYRQLLPELLADGIKVLVYAGDCDYICNWLGNKHWTLKLDWPHKDEYNSAADAPYEFDGKTVARLRSSHGLHFIQVFEAGHMVPMDQPVVALHMISQFLSGDLPSSTLEASFETKLSLFADSAKFHPAQFALLAIACMTFACFVSFAKRSSRDVQPPQSMLG